MTKRDYELIAAVMLYSRPEDAGSLSYADRMLTWERTVNEFVRVLNANPRFDAARFRKACGCS